MNGKYGQEGNEKRFDPRVDVRQPDPTNQPAKPSPDSPSPGQPHTHYKCTDVCAIIRYLD